MMELFAKPRVRLPRLAVLLGVVALSAAGAAIARADCGFAWVLGPTRGVDVLVAGGTRHDGTRYLDCPAGDWVKAVRIEGDHWTTDLSITYVRLTCAYSLDPTHTTTKEVGIQTISGTTFGPYGDGTCSGDDGAVIGAEVKEVTYITDLRLRCGTVRTAGAVHDSGWEGGYLLRRDDIPPLRERVDCVGSGWTGYGVLTGLQLSYRTDGDEYAFTAVRLRCARVESPKQYHPRLTGNTTQSAKKGYVDVRAVCSSECTLIAQGYVTLPDGTKVPLTEASSGCVWTTSWVELKLGISATAAASIVPYLQRGTDLTASLTVTAWYSSTTHLDSTRAVTLHGSS